jgi:hypothetical protein
MNFKKQIIFDLLFEKSNSFINYLNSLSSEEYLFSKNHKWTAGQHLEHLVLCIKAIEQGYKLDKQILAEKFGVTNRVGFTYEELQHLYKEKTQGGGKAPDRFVPASVMSMKREELNTEMNFRITELCSATEKFTEQELDQYCIPHPLLGMLTLREMLFNTIYHIEHHHQLTIENLKKAAVL